jgi:Zn-dependent protease with chaperone function
VRHLALLFIPTFACLLIAVASSGVQRRLAPAAGATLLTGASLTAAGAVILALGAVGFAYLSQISWAASALGWCRSLSPIDDHVPTGVGVAAIAILAGAAVRGVGYVRRSTWRSSRAPANVVVVQSSVVEAVAVPGDPSRIVVSTALLDLLGEEECEAMLAHERAHLDHRHHRFLVLAGAAAAVVPLIGPLTARVRFCTERWADECAADHIGDRALVAHAIAKAALAGVGAPPSSALSFLGIGVPGRVAALLAPQRRAGVGAGLLFATGLAGLALSIGASTLQLHHFVGFARHVCGVN